jgi:transcriptional regulator with XRE-family HTH domain
MSDDLDAVLNRARARRRLPPPAARQLIRARAGVVQEDLARALGVQTATISRWESGARTPRGGLLDRYLDALDRLARESLTS